MQFDPENNIVKLCAKGMEAEGLNHLEEAKTFFEKAWNEAGNELEKFIAAHYLARLQDSITDKLAWDETALNLALTVKDPEIESVFPSLYLNIAKGYEDLEDDEQAMLFYNKANIFVEKLAGDGYGKLLRSGIAKGIERINTKLKNK